uniref:Heteroous nuclear ribonucleoprotein L like n=1 Tax=Hucho hucho TaxID=62062 RepID=A0A4W5MQW4_9TELE
GIENTLRFHSLCTSNSHAKGDNGEDAHRIAPSPVVHVRGLCESVVEGDLVEALEKFGNICYVMMMPFKRQALVEFEAMESADQCVTCGANEAVYIAGQQAFFNYSTSKRITRPTNADDPNSGNKVLLLSIQNPLYPITTDVLYTVCNPIGNVLRIVIFKRNGIQAMVEYPFWSQKAKSALNGADIYAGCCTLKIEYARPTRLNVLRNDNDSWDYTKPFLVSNGIVFPGHYSVHFDEFSHLAPPFRKDSALTNNQTSICCSICRRFVKFMKSVPGTALVEMGDEYAVDRSITHLNSIKVFSKRLNVCVSKQHAVIPSQVFELEDGSSSYKDFAMTRNNRFSSVGQASKNIIQPPATVLHFYNVPPCITEDELQRVALSHVIFSNRYLFNLADVFHTPPLSLQASSKTISGLFEFDNKTHAVEVLTVLNHHQIRIPSKYCVLLRRECLLQ